MAAPVGRALQARPGWEQVPPERRGLFVGARPVGAAAELEPALRAAQTPDGIDVAIVATGAESAVSAADACAAKGIPFLIIVAGGFGETGPESKQLEKQVSELEKTS